MSRARAALRNTLLVVISTAVPLALLEGGLRVFSPQRPSIYEADSVVLHRLVPGSTKMFQHRRANGGGVVAVEIDSQGFRGPELSTDSNVTRIAVYGDSFIEGEFSPDAETYARQLQRLLTPREKAPFEVVNAGVVGYGPDQSLVRMRQELPWLRPSLLVLSIFADNDPGDLIRDRMFRLGPDSALVPTRYVLDTAMRRYLDHEAHPQGLRRLHIVRWVERRLDQRRPGYAANVLEGRARTDVRPTNAQYVGWALGKAQADYESFVVQGSDTVRALLGDYYDADVAITPDAPSARYKMALLERVIDAFRATADSARVSFMLLVVPSPIDICETTDVRVDTKAHPTYDPTRLAMGVEAMARRRGVPVINLYRPFGSQGACRFYLKGGNNHWNALGQATAARLTVDSLSAWGLWPRTT